jgi:hypothetical protein
MKAVMLLMLKELGFIAFENVIRGVVDGLKPVDPFKGVTDIMVGGVVSGIIELAVVKVSVKGVVCMLPETSAKFTYVIVYEVLPVNAVLGSTIIFVGFEESSEMVADIVGEAVTVRLLTVPGSSCSDATAIIGFVRDTPVADPRGVVDVIVGGVKSRGSGFPGVIVSVEPDINAKT